MFKKFSSGLLIIILIILLLVYFVVKHFSSGDRTFKDKILAFDPKAVTEILINDPTTKNEVDLKLDGKSWKVYNNGKTFNADSNAIKNILKQLSDLQTKQFAGKGKDAWAKYQVSDTSSTAIKVKLMAQSDKLAELYIGKFSYNQPKSKDQNPMQQQQKADVNTYVRSSGDKEVYTVDGFLRMNFNRDVNSYRNKMLVNVSPKEITRVVYNNPDGKMTLEKQGIKWTVNGILADSVKTARYLSTLGRLSNTNFIDMDMSGSQPAYTVNIEGNNFTPVQVKVFPVADTNINFVLNSTQNADAYFNGKKSDLFKKVLIKEQDLLPAK